MKIYEITVKSTETKAFDLFYQGNKPVEVDIKINLNGEKISKIYKDYLKLSVFLKLVSL